MGNWMRIPISCVEDLQDAVYGAGLDVTQFSRAPITGSLAFAFGQGITYSTGVVGGRVAIKGCLSPDMVTIGLGLTLAHGSRQWLNDVTTGNIAIFLPGDEHDAFYMPGSLYATATVSLERLEELAARLDLVLDARTLDGSGISSKKVPERTIDSLRLKFLQLHEEHESSANISSLTSEFLSTVITHFGRLPKHSVGRTNPQGYAIIVARARDFIFAHLDEPLSVERIALAASTSIRTLHRSFKLIYGESPYSYVLKLRLHRIRNEIISDDELSSSITSLANSWGINELGRFAGWYRDLFGELPSKTLARSRNAS